MSIPADIRHRWGTTRLVLIDNGGSLLLKPIPDDPIAAARGILREPPVDGDTLPTPEEALAQLREEDELVYRRRGWA